MTEAMLKESHPLLGEKGKRVSKLSKVGKNFMVYSPNKLILIFFSKTTKWRVVADGPDKVKLVLEGGKMSKLRCC
jgi:hypothetical protein